MFPELTEDQIAAVAEAVAEVAVAAVEVGR